MATFKKGHSARKMFKREIKIGSVAQTASGKQTWWLQDPSDAKTLRGIPAIGRNVGGAIAGTRPDQAVNGRDETRPSP